MLRLFCRRFVDIQQSYSWNFRINDGNYFSRFGRTEMNETQGYAISRYKLFHYFTRCANANQFSRVLPFHCMSSSVPDKLHVHTGIAQSVVFKIIFQDLIRGTEMFVCGCLSPVERFPSMRTNNASKSTLLKLKYFVLRQSTCYFINC